MEAVREYVNQGLSIRSKEHQKVRQPLVSATVTSLGKFVDFEDILCEELNVKTIKVGSEFELDLVVTPELKSEGFAREIIRCIQSARKDAGLNIDDRIVLVLETKDNDLKSAIKAYKDIIMAETLATELLSIGRFDYIVDSDIEKQKITISLKKS